MKSDDRCDATKNDGGEIAWRCVLTRGHHLKSVKVGDRKPPTPHIFVRKVRHNYG